MAAKDFQGVRFTNAPPTEDRTIIWSIKRADVKPRSAIILTHEVVGTHVHYFGGASYPCRGETCQACQGANRPRWEGYLAATGCDLSQRFIIAFPALAGGTVDDYWRSVRTLRGHQLTLWRNGPRNNARVVASLRSGVIPADALPPAPQLMPILLRLWRVRETQLTHPTVTELQTFRPTGTDHVDG